MRIEIGVRRIQREGDRIEVGIPEGVFCILLPGDVPVLEDNSTTARIRLYSAQSDAFQRRNTAVVSSVAI